MGAVDIPADAHGLCLDHELIPRGATVLGGEEPKVSVRIEWRKLVPLGETEARNQKRYGGRAGKKNRVEISSPHPPQQDAEARQPRGWGVSAESNLTHQCYIEMSLEVQCRALMNVLS